VEMIFNKLVFPALIILVAGPAQAEPIIESVAGEASHGMTLQITGQLFGNKPQASPRYWADFESGIDPSDLGLLQAWDEFRGELTVENGRPRSTSSIRSDISSTSGAHGPVVLRMGSDRWYAFFKRYYAFDITIDQGPIGFNLKMNRMWPEQRGSALPYGNNIRMSYQGSEGLVNGRTTAENTQGERHRWGNSTPFIPEAWQTDEIVYALGGVDVKNGIFDYYRNGEKAGGDSQWIMRTAERPHRYEQFFFDQVSNGTGPGPLWVYYDEIYLDDTWARVMICTRSIWTMCKRKEIQIPTSWSDTNINIVLNFGDINIQNNTLYIYVIAEDGSVNQRGVLVRKCSKCPEPPTNQVAE